MTKYIKPLYAPSLWPSWVAVGVFWLIGQLPWNWLLTLGRGLGHLSWHLARRRRHIAETNIRLCFPELSADKQQALAKASIISTGESLLEMAGLYFNQRIDLGKRLDIVGREYLDAALARGQGVILLGMHFNDINAGIRLLGQVMYFNGVYRPNDNPVMDWVICHGRGKYMHNIPREDIRQTVRCLKKGEVVWYAPDQDYGRAHAVYVPFFGQTAATITTTSRLAKMGNAVVIPCANYRLKGGRYQIVLGEPLADFPSGDDVADTTLINKTIEAAVREHPEQYLWVHRRFKHQPDGRKGPY
jgi:KDO2-lipid IV(A) lauroyltransferase